MSDAIDEMSQTDVDITMFNCIYPNYENFTSTKPFTILFWEGGFSSNYGKLLNFITKAITIIKNIHNLFHKFWKQNHKVQNC
jgi:hypothetical protein